MATLFATVMILSNVAQSFHNHSQDKHKFLPINSLKQQKQVASWAAVILMQLKLFDPAIALLISLGTYFFDTPQWDLFLFLMLSVIKYSSQMIFLSLLIFSYYPLSIVP